MKKRTRIIITILLIIVIAIIILYPKIKPLLALNPETRKVLSKVKAEIPVARQGRQILNVSGFLIQPQRIKRSV